MKINNHYQINFGNNGKKQDNKESIQPASIQPVDASASECQSIYNRAMIKNKDERYTYIDKGVEFASKILEQNEHIKYPNIDQREGETVVRMRAGKEIDNFPDLYTDDFRIACYFDKDGNVNRAFKLNKNTKEITVYDRNGKQTHHYTKEDMEALYYYKYHPDSIHTKLRKGRDHWGGSWQEETNEMVNRLISLFNDESKVSKTTEDTTLYRALQENLTEEQMEALSTIGGVYTDPSFCSTTENLEVAQRFSCKNPILKINVPKGTKYIDVERLFNVNQNNWHEKELLLGKNTHFIVTGFDTENNIIEVSISNE